jgi:uncharacterized protein
VRSSDSRAPAPGWPLSGHGPSLRVRRCAQERDRLPTALARALGARDDEQVSERAGSRNALPLFPLSTVLVPGQPLPLHVFEKRYRLLVERLLALPAGAPRRFGVVAIRRGREVGPVPELHEVGCTADLQQVQALPDGRFDIVTTGGVRFRVVEVDLSQPYLTAEVDLLPEPAGRGAGPLATMVRSAYEGYADALSAVGVEAREPRALPVDPIALSYAVAAAMALDLPERQALLASADAAARLATERALLRRETALLRRTSTVPGATALLGHDGAAPN